MIDSSYTIDRCRMTSYYDDDEGRNMTTMKEREAVLARSSKYREGLTVRQYFDAVSWYQYALYGKDGEDYDADKWNAIVGAIIKRLKRGQALTIDNALRIIERAQDSRYSRTSYDRIVSACKRDSTDAGAISVMYTLTQNDNIESPALGYIAQENAREWVEETLAKMPEEKRARIRAERDKIGINNMVRETLYDPAKVNAWRVYFHRRAGYGKRLHIADLLYITFKYI